MKFFEDPNEFDHHIIPIILECIKGGEWDLVLREIEKHTDVIKTEILRLDENHPEHGYWMLKNCESASDVLHTRGMIQGDRGEAFRQCLSALFSIRDAIGQPFDDEDHVKDDFRADVERYRQNVKDILLMDVMPMIWQRDKNLKKGPSSPKHLIVLDEFIRTLMNENQNISTAAIQKKLKAYREHKPFFFDRDDGQNYKLYFVPEENKIVQEIYIFEIDETIILKSRAITLAQVRKYRDRILEEKKSHPEK